MGGQILCEAHVDFKKNYFEFGQWLIHQLEQLDNVEIRLNTRVDAKLVDEIKPDALICALGADPLILDIPGIDDERVIYATELAKEN
ncbi:MAG: hypothetical protein PWP20_757, partial [Eubacteriaceae bacterium]|nr:hypothetical protein [Eubacteriaceae bacterium]